MLRLALARPDQVEVRLACLGGLLKLAPDYALPYLRTCLDGPDAAAALRALSPRRADARVVKAVRAALGQRGEASVLEAFADGFADGL